MAKAAEDPALQLDVRTAILMDAGTGQFLYETEGADKPLPPASMAKMMTEFIVMENIKSGKLTWEELITTTQNAADVIGSQALLAVNEKLTVRQMFAAVSIYSANDAAVALAEHIAGSEEEFAKLMNETAKRLGLSADAHFINATGLSRKDMGKYVPESIEGETLLTARDAALLAYYIIRDHPEVLEFTKQPSFKLRERDKDPMVNWDWMVEGNKDNVYLRKYAYEGLDGLKTGSTDEAKWCFTGTAVRDGMRLISVVMGAPSEPKRFEETRKLLDYGFKNFEKRTLLDAKVELPDAKTAEVKKGKEPEVPVVTDGKVELIVKKSDKVEPEVKVEWIEETKRVAPIEAGAVMGTATVLYNGKEVQKVNLVAAEKVEKANWFALLFRSIGSFFGNLFSGVKNMF
ncbi:D-alanyl-D-alanine carboxypeptidase family protein [Paenibacillus turpanensis]|uniref:D-alanyl-D-alanine carboxypeptidase family protein n=1 Tax=Paenibacillus turpanensis TaxID=2689078 RepID=UPI001FB7105D|nr:D-alanyl-D-alanine carboxypeptidase family protein [Paenibacillus turpanensis]